ncbi:protein of unknown function [Methylorubrum extorquens]|uniref:Uncharacterized protein n=1 Tax=Methylorubrum extorquens TaxID=408 RepID=A0A2N9AYT8_METEX|nr:protein of unknown function [Methylorubrum extorquens]
MPSVAGRRSPSLQRGRVVPARLARGRTVSSDQARRWRGAIVARTKGRHWGCPDHADLAGAAAARSQQGDRPMNKILVAATGIVALILTSVTADARGFRGGGGGFRGGGGFHGAGFRGGGFRGGGYRGGRVAGGYRGGYGGYRGGVAGYRGGYGRYGYRGGYGRYGGGIWALWLPRLWPRGGRCRRGRRLWSAPLLRRRLWRVQLLRRELRWLRALLSGRTIVLRV